MKLLLAEDDAILAEALGAQLRRAGFEVEHAPNGAVAEYLLLKAAFDIAILDLGLPMVDGLTVLKRLRQARRNVPVLVLTALDSLDDRVAGLNAGADDYLTKPFDFPELEARLHALLRRGRPLSGGTELARLSFDRETRRATAGGEPLDLSPREAMLLDLLLQERDKVVTKEQISQAWAQDKSESSSGAGSIEVYIHRLRRKLEQSGLAIRTVRGLGYLLEVEAAA
ncbi:response regulator transcription factor [Roseateles violae]|uniref:Response regulator transcription factor n=1 Tax=Roseateles violae TaxID=3058042 RepID=A0ABT8E055_9BURK|nr:response regulator transcription factor [Pelomonas sp. PFR6]MDN3923184.1 response regulator transcription factor [Pelomonas sp. PFR6]